MIAVMRNTNPTVCILEEKFRVLEGDQGKF